MNIINSRGDSILFEGTVTGDFKLYQDFDTSGLSASVNYIDGTSDGSYYQNTVLDNREFDVPFFIHRQWNGYEWIENKRHEAFKVFNPKANPFKVEFTTKSGEEYYINANLTASPSFPVSFSDHNNEWQKGLLQFVGTDPYIYKKNATTAYIATWVSAFEFPLEIPINEGVEFGYRSESLIANVVNDGQEKTGMIITFKALGDLTNPSLFNMDTRDELKISTTMQAGDIIEVSTYERQKYIKLIKSNGDESNLFNAIDFNSRFLQLDVGDNNFRYDADIGIDNLEISMTFNPRYLGV